MPDYNVLPEDMNLGIHPFIMTDAERTAKETELQQKLVLLQEQYLQMDGPEDLRRLDQQTQSIQMRLNLLAQTVLNDQKLRQPIRTLNFTTDVTFSPQLREEILARERTREIVQQAAMRVANELGYSQGRDPENKKIDLRDFREMIEVSSELTPEEITAQAESYVRDYLSDDPILHKARLDEFYDRVDSIDLAALDLSCLSGVRNETGQLSNSERDFLKLISLTRSNQTIAIKASENPGYLEARYPTPEARLRYDLMQDLLVTHGFLPYTIIDVMNNNLFDSGLHPIENKRPLNNPVFAVVAQICLQTYRQQLSALQGISTGSSNIKLIIPDNAAQGFYNSTHSNAPDASVILFDDLLGPVFKNVVAKKYMQETGLSYEDLIFIDGISLREKMDQEYPNLSALERDTQTKHAVTQALFSGDHRVELASIQMNSLGSYSIEVSSLEANMHAMDKYELQEEHSAFRRAFNFGLSKVETRADRADKLWANDPDRQKRQTAIRDSVNRQVAASINTRTKQQQQRMEQEQREHIHTLMNDAFTKQIQTTANNDLAFFGWLIGDPKPQVFTPDVQKALNSLVHETLKVSIPEDMSAKVGIPFINQGKYSPLDTLFRQDSRVTLVTLYALSMGMPLEEALSDDPALNEQKEAIGRSFMEAFTLLGTEEFYEKNGRDADYEAYFEERHRDMYHLYETLHEVLNEQSIDCLTHSTTPEELAENYTHMDFLRSASQDITQTPSNRIRTVDYPHIDALEKKARCLGECQNILHYCTYLGSDSYLNPNINDGQERSLINKICAYKANMDHFQETCKDMQTVDEVSQKVNESWSFDASNLLVTYSVTDNSDPTLFQDQVNYLRTGKNPLHFKDKKTGEYTIGCASKIRTLQEKEHNAMSWKDFEEIAELNQKYPAKQTNKEAPEHHKKASIIK